MKLSSCCTPIAMAVLSLGMMAVHFGSASAATNSNLYKCSGNKSFTLQCCNRFVQKGNLPKWWKETNSSCNKAIVCSGGSGGQGLVKKCYIRQSEYEPPKQNSVPGCGGTPGNCRKSGSGGGGGGGGTGRAKP